MDINSEALSAKNALTTFSLSYLGMISTGSKSLSPGELDKLLNTMKKRMVKTQKEESLTGDRPSASKEIAPVTRSPNLRVKKKTRNDIGPTISVVSVDEGPRKNRAGSFNEQRKEPKRHKKHSFDGTLSAEQPLVGQQQNGQHLEVTDGADYSSVPVDYDTVDLPVNKSDTLSMGVELPKRSAILILTSKTITLQDANDNRIIRKKKVTEIASCTQVCYVVRKCNGLLLVYMYKCHCSSL